MSLEIAYAELERLESRTSPPAVLYHYTKAAGFRGILKTDVTVFHATNIFYLNDASEFFVSTSLIEDFLQKSLSDPSFDAEDKFFISSAKDDLQDLIELPTGMQFFVSCFSSAKDDLGQWRAYGRGEGGIAIGLSGAQLREEAHAAKGFLLPVMYYDKNDVTPIARNNVNEINVILRAILKDAVEAYKTELRNAFIKYQKDRAYRNAFTNWFEAIGFVMCIIKNPGFRNENEWRIIVSRQLSDVDFIATNYFLRPYVELVMKKDNLVTEVGIGPGRVKALSRSSAEAYLRKNGYTLPSFWVSDIPYRVMEG